MKIGRCSNCRHHITLEMMMQDKAAQELTALVTQMDTLTGTALAAYLGLFRSRSRDLANDRALRLAREALALSADLDRLGIAMSETVEAIRVKGGAKPLTNHKYLEKVLADVQARPIVLREERRAVAPKSKTGQAMAALESLKRG